MILGPFQAQFEMIFNSSLWRFLHLLLLFARSATHIAESAPNTAKTHQETKRIRRGPYRSTVPTHPLTFTRHTLQNESQARQAPNAGAAVSTPHGVFDNFCRNSHARVDLESGQQSARPKPRLFCGCLRKRFYVFHRTALPRGRGERVSFNALDLH